jgi:hypothetical protein
VETLRQEMDTSLASADIELYFSAQADGYGLVESPGSDSVVNNTPAEDYQVERAIYYNNTGLASYATDSGWSTLTANTESYAAAKARVEDYIRGGTYGKLPCTFAVVRTEESVRTGLLVDYPGAAAAYSLRLLDTDYAGSAIRVRRASDNAEQDIGFDGSGDLDTTSLATFCSGTDGFVKVWYDQSGNANDATQTTTGDQPKIYDSATGVVTENGKPVLDFTSGNISLDKSSPVGFDNMDSFSLIMAGNFTLLENYDYNFTIVDTAGLDVILRNEDPTTFRAGAFSPGSGLITVASSVGRHLIFAGYGTNAQVAIDSTSTTGTINISSYGASDVLYINRVGAGLNAQAKYYEIIAYPSDQSTNRTGIESNINTYYSIYP